MPYFSIETNQKVFDANWFADIATEFISEQLDKPEKFIMISLKIPQTMYFDRLKSPTAMVQLKSIGLPENKDALIGAIFNFIEWELKIPKDRIYLELINLERENFAWNGKNFKP
ncbi:MAG: phenylpyruvate tautomerase MIF-related protein [Candidatus Delongbacteria bacterium]|jgi:phenylpyruvate tautomerase|nr:phenylpyruvate tautomerase MIF-related protein [Candidatus Delongbacteria bacterium]